MECKASMAMVRGSFVAIQPRKTSKGLGGMEGRMLIYQRPESDHGWNAEGLYQVLLLATGACEHAWIIKDTRTQFHARIFHGMVVPMLAMESCFSGLWSCKKIQRLWTGHKDPVQ